eukprot:7854717-Alexandrium_andersonii.AAC.1
MSNLQTQLAGEHAVGHPRGGAPSGKRSVTSWLQILGRSIADSFTPPMEPVCERAPGYSWNWRRIRAGWQCHLPPLIGRNM